MYNVTVSVGIVKNVSLNLKPLRGKKLPLKVKRAIEKHSHHDQSFCGLEEFVLLYPERKEALFLPGITSTRFQLDSYKEELGKPYSQIVLSLCSISGLIMSVVALLNFRAEICLCQELLPLILIKFMKMKCLSSLMIKKEKLIYL